MTNAVIPHGRPQSIDYMILSHQFRKSLGSIRSVERLISHSLTVPTGLT